MKRNKAAQIISIKIHQNPVYYEKMKERLDNLIIEQKEKRVEDAGYFNSYKKLLQELLDEENERKKLGLSNKDEFTMYEDLLKVLKDKDFAKSFTNKISEGIKKETRLVGWQEKICSEKEIRYIIYDILSEIQTKKFEDNKIKKRIGRAIYRSGKKKLVNYLSVSPKEIKSKQIFQYGNKIMDYNLVQSKRRKTIEVVVDKGRITIRTPFDKSIKEIEQILNDKIKWISQKQKEIQNEQSEIFNPTFEDHSILPYLGKNYILKIIHVISEEKSDLIKKYLLFTLMKKNLIRVMR